MRTSSRALLLGGVALLCIALLWVGPLVPLATQRWVRAAGIALDGVVLLWILFALQWVRSGWTQASRWRGSWRAWLTGGAWAALVAFETARMASVLATNEVLPLYDLGLLSRHLFILVRDLYGSWARAGFAMALAAPVLLWVVGALGLGRVEAAGRAVGPRVSRGVVGGLTVAALLLALLPNSRWVTPGLTSNVAESAALALAVRRGIQTQPHRDLVGRDLKRTPDVHVYIVESYGDVVDSDPLLRAEWVPAIDAMEERLTALGWHAASGRSVAPVHGGRSWIADASMLTGLHVARQATYEHIVSLADTLDHFPALFREHGYRTVLVRPKDRARPGVELINHFRFEDTVFFEDLGYTGPVVGWGHIPDQYTIDFVHRVLLDPSIEPTFAFFHLATAHMPWRPAPPILADHIQWQSRRGRTQPIFVERSLESELGMRLSRFKRRRRPKSPSGDVAEMRQLYLDNIMYDLAAVERVLEGGPEGDQIVLILGDHQPPMIAIGTGREVPVHVLASDPALLEGFLEAGFTDRLRPRGGDTAAVPHHEVLAVTLRSLHQATQNW